MEKGKATIVDFLNKMGNMTEEEKAAELKHFSAIDRANILCTEYIAGDIYPQGKFNRNMIKLTLRFNGKNFYPIVGWNPDATHPNSSSALIPPMRRWLSRLKKYQLHNSQENRTYILYA